MSHEVVLNNRPSSLKRYCFALDVKNDAKLIEEYRFYHSSGMWPDIIADLKEIGIFDMEIYIVANRLFMILEVPLSFDYDAEMGKLANRPKQQEWEQLMWKFQQKLPWIADNTKWDAMERIFSFAEMARH